MYAGFCEVAWQAEGCRSGDKRLGTIKSGDVMNSIVRSDF